jgi:acylphosphatase
MRYEATFTGRVQGVGFRASAQSLARRHDVTGWVRNEPEGSVKLVAEGEKAALDAYFDDLRAQMGEHISGEQIDDSQPERGYAGFEIRY